MKKIWILLAVLAITAETMAQQAVWDKIRMQFRSGTAQENTKNIGYVTFTGDKVWLVKDGSTVLADDIIVMLNGTMIMPDGSIRLQNKKTSQMKEGDSIDLNGIMQRVKKAEPVADRTKEDI